MIEPSLGDRSFSACSSWADVFNHLLWLKLHKAISNFVLEKTLGIKNTRVVIGRVNGSVERLDHLLIQAFLFNLSHVSGAQERCHVVKDVTIVKAFSVGSTSLSVATADVGEHEIVGRALVEATSSVMACSLHLSRISYL